MLKLKEKLLKEIDKIEIIDSHEHLDPENEAIKLKRDIFSFFSGYTQCDLISSGLSQEDLEKLFDQSVSIDERWKILKPFWERIKNTCFSQSLLITLREIYGFDDINSKNIFQLSDMLAENFRIGIYNDILVKKCNIRKVLTQCFRTDVDSNNEKLLLPVMPLWVGAGSTTGRWEDFQNLGPMTKIDAYLPEWEYKDFSINALDDCLENQSSYYKRIKREGAIGVKFVPFPKFNLEESPDEALAIRDFDDFKNHKFEKLPQPNNLYSYLLDRAISSAIENGLVISVHTGFWGDFRILSPLNIIPVLMRYPQGKFDLYHLGYPWIRESIMIAKGFQNAFLNFCWLHIISRKAAMDAMDEALETVPVNKIIAFGGDYNSLTVEKIYGHLKIAKDNIAEVLKKKIDKGELSYKACLEIPDKIFSTNIKQLYGL
ncbi:MAG: hypothetical protein FJW66_05050 [Actinobacteria bacterium]|nr:hypothetical protein [Actinomycetota bacterium]